MSSPPDIDAVRARTVDLLSAHFAHDGFPVEELDRRLDAAYRAESLHELEALVRDLPQGPTALARASSAELARYEDVPEDLAGEESERILSVMAETRRTGLWVVPRRLDVVSVMSETTLDLRQASLAPGITTIHVGGVMTAVKIIVPPGVRVMERVFAFMASTRDRTAELGEFLGPEAPVIRIEGWAVMAEVVVRRG